MKPAIHFKTGVAVGLLLVAAMTGTAAISGRHEWFFPELPALAMGCFWMESRPWHTDRLRLFFSMVFGAVTGYALCLLPETVPTPCKLLAGFALCALHLTVWRINLTPMFSACLLPLLLGGVGPLYPAAITVEAGLLCLIEMALERCGIVRVKPFEPLPDPFSSRLRHWGELTLLFAGLLFAARFIGPYAAVPPLIVAFCVFADLRRPARKHLLCGIGFCALAAACGAAGRMACLAWHIPEAAAIAGGILLLAAGCRIFAYFLPPSAAALLLPFLIPETQLTSYVWQAPLGAVLFLTAGRIYSLACERRIPKAGGA